MSAPTSTKRINKAGIEVPSWFKGNPENYNPNFKKEVKPLPPRINSAGIEVPSWFKGNPETYDPNHKKTPKAPTVNSKGFEVPVWWPGNPENFNPDRDLGKVKSTDVETKNADSTAETESDKQKVYLIEPVEDDNSEAEYYETDSGLIKIKDNTYMIEGNEVAQPFIKYLASSGYEGDSEPVEVHALLFHISGKIYIYIGEEVVLFTSDEPILMLKHDDGFYACTETHYIMLPYNNKVPRAYLDADDLSPYEVFA